MIKKTLFFTLAFVLMFSLFAFAGEGSDTIGACKLLPQLRYSYSVSDWRKFSQDGNTFRNWDTRTNDYYLQANWGIFNNVDVIALIGGESLCAESGQLIGVTAVTFNELKAKHAPMFLWGVGFKATFFRADNGFYVGGGALFTHALSNHFEVDSYVNGVHTGETDYTRRDYKLVPELHVGYHFKNIGLTPYLGVDYVWAKSHIEEVDDEDNDSNYFIEHPVNMFGGLDYFLNDKLYINVEGRTNFIDGWGVGTGVGYLFDICGAPAPAPEPIPAPVIEPKLEPMSKN
jgi:hypothetical protein